jgi:hypothetical protein
MGVFKDFVCHKDHRKASHWFSFVHVTNWYPPLLRPLSHSHSVRVLNRSFYLLLCLAIAFFYLKFCVPPLLLSSFLFSDLLFVFPPVSVPFLSLLIFLLSVLFTSSVFLKICFQISIYHELLSSCFFCFPFKLTFSKPPCYALYFIKFSHPCFIFFLYTIRNFKTIVTTIKPTRPYNEQFVCTSTIT